MQHTILPGRNIRIEYLPHACRIHSVPANGPELQASGEYLAEFSCGALPYPSSGDLILLNYGSTVFTATLPGVIDPLYFNGDNRILAQITEIETQGKTAGRGKARIFGTAPVAISSSLSQRGRRFALPAGNGSWVFSKRGGARLLPRLNGQYLVSLGPFETAPDLYTGPFTVDFNEAGTEYVVYDSSAASASQIAGTFRWSGNNSATVPRMSVAGTSVTYALNLYAGWNGSGISFSLSNDLTSAQAQTGIEVIELAAVDSNGLPFQIRRGNIDLPWRV